MAHLTKLRWKLTEDEKQEVVDNYCAGISISIIGRNFKIDHSTVYYHLKKARVYIAGQPKELRSVGQIIMPRPLPKKEIVLKKIALNVYDVDLDGSPLCEGHSYADYLKIDMARKKKRPSVI